MNEADRSVFEVVLPDSSLYNLDQQFEADELSVEDEPEPVNGSGEDATDEYTVSIICPSSGELIVKGILSKRYPGIEPVSQMLQATKQNNGIVKLLLPEMEIIEETGLSDELVHRISKSESGDNRRIRLQRPPLSKKERHQAKETFRRVVDAAKAMTLPPPPDLPNEGGGYKLRGDVMERLEQLALIEQAAKQEGVKLLLSGT